MTAHLDPGTPMPSGASTPPVPPTPLVRPAAPVPPADARPPAAAVPPQRPRSAAADQDRALYQDQARHQGLAPHHDRAQPHDPQESHDPLEHPDPYRVADAAGAENLLRCWARETGLPEPADGLLRVPLPASGAEGQADVLHWSATGHHRFGPVRLAPAAGSPLTAVALAALLAREGGGTAADGDDLVARVADSVRRTAVFVTERRARPGRPDPELPFLDSEQALLLGHPTHPAPKGREGLSDSESAAYSPETHGFFALHWLAVDTAVAATDSAWTDRGRPIPAADLLAAMAGPELDCPSGTVPLPLHPWQARDLRHRPAVQRLFDTGLLRDLGPLGEPWHPTSSVRTVYRPDAPAMLKLSLALRITNSRRENLRKELKRGTEVHRLLRTGLAAQWHAFHPGFDIVRDPAWIGVDTPDGTPVPGLDVVLRHSPFGPGDQAHCVAGLTSPRPWPGVPAPALRSLLAVLVGRLAERSGRPATAVATEWFLRYLDAVVRPVLWLDGEAGIALEAHQQNTLVLLDAHGWPTGGRYRDNQGYYFRESHRAELQRRLPGIGADSDTFVSDEVADERFAYYLGVNNVLGLIGAFGSQRLADEQVLLAAFRRFLAAAAGGRSSLPARLLDAPELRGKANLLTRLHGMDELVGPVDTQSVYITMPNPLTV